MTILVTDSQVKDSKDLQLKLKRSDIVDTNVRYVIQIVAPDSGDAQITELVLQSTTLNSNIFWI